MWIGLTLMALGLVMVLVMLIVMATVVAADVTHPRRILRGRVLGGGQQIDIHIDIQVEVISGASVTVMLAIIVRMATGDRIGGCRDRGAGAGYGVLGIVGPIIPGVVVASQMAMGIFVGSRRGRIFVTFDRTTFLGIGRGGGIGRMGGGSRR